MGYDASGAGKLYVKTENFPAVVEAYKKWAVSIGYPPRKIVDMEDMFADQGFDSTADDLHNLFWVDFAYNRYSDQGDFLEMLAPWAENGSYIDFTGEDNSMWRCSIYDHRYYETSGVVVFPGDPYDDAEDPKQRVLWSVEALRDKLDRLLRDYENNKGDGDDLWHGIAEVITQMGELLNGRRDEHGRETLPWKNHHSAGDNGGTRGHCRRQIHRNGAG